MRVATPAWHTAVSGFSAFQGSAYGLTGPMAGLLTDRHAYVVAFLFGGLAASLGFVLVAAIARPDRRQATWRP